MVRRPWLRSTRLLAGPPTASTSLSWRGDSSVAGPVTGVATVLRGAARLAPADAVASTRWTRGGAMLPEW